MAVKSRLDRRQFIAAGVVSALTLWIKPSRAAVTGARGLSFNNLHTGEKLAVDYWEDGAYLPQALGSINRLLRDFRTGEVHSIDVGLLDLLTTLRAKLETKEPINVISGYRSPTTNGKLHEGSSGVAVNSLHMTGSAIDIAIPGRSLNTVRKVALDMGRGGVGYYPKSGFVHVDVGRVRFW
jgi:uncharacterized protein YcbK (DUF882 family)